MPWFKVDDKLAFHPKVLAAGNAAMGLWVRAGSWASDQLTDGFVPSAMVELLDGNRGSAAKLARSGLWIPEDRGGFRFHDWQDLNPLRAQVLDARDNRAASATLANHNRWHAQRGVIDPDCKHCADQTRRSVH